MGETDGRRGVWGYVRGGMGGLTQALARAAARPRRRDPLRGRGGPHRSSGTAAPPAWSSPSGEELRAPLVVEQCRRPRHVPAPRRGRATLPAEFLAAVGRISYASASLKINVALAELPDFRAVPGTRPGPQHRGTIHICPDLDYIERAYDDAKYGRPSARPVLECTIPSVVDDDGGAARPAPHVDLRAVRAVRAGRGPLGSSSREPFADRCFALLDEYAPNFSRSVLARQVLTPLDIERTFDLTGGNIFQGAMTPSQLFSFRPVPGHADYRTPVRGLYLCGAATHPGGGVMGAPGYNAAREILRDRRRPWGRF